MARSAGMTGDELAQAPAIEGYFRRKRAGRARPNALPLILIMFVAAAAAYLARSPITLVAAALVCGFALVVFLDRSMRPAGGPNRVKVRLAGADFTIHGDGYAIRLEAPFRFKTGVERKAAAANEDETCFIRMVIDVHGKPLVFEEQVLAGYYPPQLAEIAGLSSALGLAELTSLTPYPGALWSLIEGLESLTQAGPVAEPEDKVDSLYRIGRRQLDENDFLEAVETFGALLRLRPDSAAAYYSRGAARYHARTDLDKALNDLTTALRLEPSQYKAYRMRGLVKGRQGDWAGQRDDCSMALRYHPTSAELHNLRGTACYRLKDYDAALANFDDAIRLDATRHESFYNRGLARHRLGKLAEAIEDFQQASNLNPAFVEARQNLQRAQQQLARRRARSGS